MYLPTFGDFLWGSSVVIAYTRWSQDKAKNTLQVAYMEDSVNQSA